MRIGELSKGSPPFKYLRITLLVQKQKHQPNVTARARPPPPPPPQRDSEKRDAWTSASDDRQNAPSRVPPALTYLGQDAAGLLRRAGAGVRAERAPIVVLLRLLNERRDEHHRMRLTLC